MNEVEITITITKDLEDSLEILAHDLNKSMEYIITTALEKYIRDCEESGDLE